jgi:cytochrome P450
MTGATEQMLAQWRARADAGAPLDVFQEMMRLTLRLALQTLLGTSADADLVKLSVTVTEILVRTNDIITNPLYPPLWLPLPRSVSFKRAVRDLDEFVYRTIAARRAGGGNATDLLSMLLAARDDQTGQGMSDQQLRDEAVTTLIAGHETTANALTWALYLVSEHADVREALRAELTAVLGGRTPTFDDLPRLRYTRAVLDETMRLYPPAWMISRRAIEADQIGPYDIAPGEFVLISPYLLHRNPDLWDDVLRFDPQRFLDGRADALPKCAYMPFGAGPRFCIGATFALIEATLVLATVARRVDLSVIPGFPVVPYAMITLRPRHGLKMTPRFVGDR